MKIKSIASGKLYEIDIKSEGENNMPCPECSSERKKKNLRCFSFNAKKGAGFCNHCESRFVEYKKYEKIEYVKPKWENFTELPEKAVKWFENRMITQTALKKMKVSYKKAWMPQTQKEEDVIAFPFLVGDEVVNIKYRDKDKNFKLESGCELVWYNYNAIKNEEVVIVEGEIDCLSFISDDIENVISVPNGASIGKMDYFVLEDLAHVKKFYICTDNDEKGLILRNELVRRLGIERCYICSTKECKDGNEYLCTYGRGSLKEVLDTAKQPSIDGIFDLDSMYNDIVNLYENGLQRGVITGFSELDRLVSWETKRFAVFSGTPSSGKSELLDFIAGSLNIRHGWKVAYCSPENFPMQYHYAKIFEKLTGERFKANESISFDQAYEHIKENFFWINPYTTPNLDSILERFKYFVRAKGVKVVVLDPFNKIEDEVEYKQQGRLLNKMISFAKENDVLFCLVAHPKKLQKDSSGLLPMPTPYDISGTSDIWNMADYIIMVGRDQDAETKTFLSTGSITISKVKFKNLGEQGMVKFQYDTLTGRYSSPNVRFDRSNWLTSEYVPTPILPSVDLFESQVDNEIPF